MTKHFQFEANMTLSGAAADKRVAMKIADQKQALVKIYNIITGAAVATSLDKEFDAKTKNFKEVAGSVSDISGVFSNALQGFQSAEEKSIETKYQKQIDAAKKAGKDTTKIEEEKNQKLAEVRAKYADAEFALQVAQIIATTAVAAINSFAAMCSAASFLAFWIVGFTNVSIRVMRFLS